MLKAVNKRHLEVCGKGFGRFGGNGVGVGVEHRAFLIVRERCHHGGNASVEQQREAFRVHAVYVAHKTVVYTVFQRTAVRLYHVHVCPRQSERVDVLGLQFGYDVFVDKSSIHHRHHAQHLLVGHTAAIDHSGLYAEAASHVGSCATAAVHEYFVAFEPAEVGKQSFKGFGRFNDFSAHFYDCKCLFHDAKLRISAFCPFCLQRAGKHFWKSLQRICLLLASPCCYSCVGVVSEEYSLVDEATYRVGVVVGAYHERIALLRHHKAVQPSHDGFHSLRQTDDAVLRP